MSYKNDKELKEAQKKWISSALQQRNPAGYQQHLDSVKAYKNKGKSSDTPSSAPKKKDKSETWNAKPYIDSDAYKANEQLIKDAQSYKPKELKIGDKGQSNEEWYKDQFKGIDPVDMPGEVKKPNLKKVKGYTGKESWAGRKKSSQFKPSLTMPKRLKAKDLMISTKTPYGNKKKLGPSGPGFKPTSPKDAGFGKVKPNPSRLTNKKRK